MSSIMQANEETLLKQSRSFAIPILHLEERFRTPIMVQYNLNKTIDTIEDNPHLSVEDKIQWIHRFCEALLQGKSDPQLQTTLTAVTPVDESYVFSNYPATIALYNQLSQAERHLAHTWTEEMADGMCRFLKKDIITMQDLNQYCYYVAGSVGIYLTRLLQLKGDDIKPHDNQQWEDNAVHFGLFLQKLNVIRDYKEDLYDKQRSFWPREFAESGLDKLEQLNHLCEETVRHDVPAAIQYCCDLPAGNASYDYFIRFILRSGLEYMKLLYNNERVFAAHKVKLPRFLIQHLYRRVARQTRETFVHDAYRLHEEFLSIMG